MAVDVLVCNLTRFGDLIQTQPLLDDLNLAGYSTGLLCLDNFASSAALLRGVREIWPFNGAPMMASLPAPWPDACARVLWFARGVNANAQPRYVLNLTPAITARLLARLLSASGPKLLGFGLDEFGYAMNGGVWASFISVAARQRVNAPFNVADMLRKMALPLSGNTRGDFRLAPVPESASAWADEFLRGNSPASGVSGFVGFQLGASNDERRWPVANFRELGEALWRRHGLVPVLLGSPSETELAQRYAQTCAHPFIDATGKTSLPQLAAILRRCRLLVTNDTGTMHLAAGHDVPVLAFFLARAQPWDTGPQRPGCCCLEPALDCHPCAFNHSCSRGNECRRRIGSESAFSLIDGWLSSGDWQSGMNSRVTGECRVWLTSRMDDGLSGVKLLGGGNNAERNLWLPLLRDFWSQLLDDMDRNAPAQEAAAKKIGIKKPVPAQMASLAVPALEQCAVILDSIHACGAVAGKSSQARQLLLKNGQRLLTLLDSCPPLATIGEFWREFTRNQFENMDSFLPAALFMAGHCRRFASQLTDNMSNK